MLGPPAGFALFVLGPPNSLIRCAQSIMLALREGDDETAQLAALNELCELLAVSSEDALSMFPVDTLVPVLVRSLDDHDLQPSIGLAGKGCTYGSVASWLAPSSS